MEPKEEVTTERQLSPSLVSSSTPPFYSALVPAPRTTTPNPGLLNDQTLHQSRNNQTHPYHLKNQPKQGKGIHTKTNGNKEPIGNRKAA
ncbi:hypothetical protein PCANC_14801 [Puccinia coronata f. sp. avenae]|nr:hypothetical protein PCANC_14801 [Puccinia coronata f. sp. avenae]PLW38310.1 hypothetical protein PCASD_08970 [Puccinia coronata f. sp. avenae]